MVTICQYYRTKYVSTKERSCSSVRPFVPVCSNNAYSFLDLVMIKLTFLTFDETKQVVNTFVSLFHTNILVGSTIYAERYLLMDLVCKPPRWQMFAKTCFYWSNPALSYSTLFCKFSKPSAGVNYGSNSSSASNCPMAFISKRNILSDVFPVAPFSNLWMVVMVMPDYSETSFCVMLLRRR